MATKEITTVNEDDNIAMETDVKRKTERDLELELEDDYVLNLQSMLNLLTLHLHQVALHLLQLLNYGFNFSPGHYFDVLLQGLHGVRLWQILAVPLVKNDQK